MLIMFFYHYGVPGVEKLLVEKEDGNEMILLQTVVAVNTAAAAFVNIRNSNFIN